MAGSSIWPILAVVLGLYFAFSDFSKYLGENLKWLHRITSLVAFINIAAAQITSHYFNNYAVSSSLCFSSILLVSTLLGNQLGWIAIEVSDRDYKWSSKNINLVILHGF